MSITEMCLYLKTVRLSLVYSPNSLLISESTWQAHREKLEKKVGSGQNREDLEVKNKVLALASLT